MKINLSGHHVDITDAVREHINDKLTKIGNPFSSLVSLDIIVSKAHGNFEVEMRTKYEGAGISATGKDAVMYPAISKATKKLRFFRFPEKQ